MHISSFIHIYFHRETSPWNQPENIWYIFSFFIFCCSVAHEPFFICAAREEESETWISRPLPPDRSLCVRSDLKCSKRRKRPSSFSRVLLLCTDVNKKKKKGSYYQETDCRVRHVQYTWWFLLYCQNKRHRRVPKGSLLSDKLAGLCVFELNGEKVPRAGGSVRGKIKTVQTLNVPPLTFKSLWTSTNCPPPPFSRVLASLLEGVD